MAKPPISSTPPITIPFFGTGLFTHRSQLYAPFRSLGVNIVSYHDALLGGANMELTDLMELQRRPGYSRYCSVAVADGEIVNQFYAFRTMEGAVNTFFDSNQRWAVFTPTSITTLLVKSTTAQGYVQQVGLYTYFFDGVDAVMWDGTSVHPIGLPAPTNAPSLTPTGLPGFWIKDTVYKQNQPLLDENGNLEVAIVGPGTSGQNSPRWSPNFLGTVVDGPALKWQNGSSIGAWQANTLFPMGSIILDNSGNLQMVTAINTPSAGSVYSFQEQLQGQSMTLVIKGVAQPYQVGQRFLLNNFSTTGGGQQFNGVVVTITDNSTPPNYTVQWAGTHSDTATVVNGTATPLFPQTSGDQVPPFAIKVGGIAQDANLTWTCLGPGTQLATAGYSWRYAFRTVEGQLSTASDPTLDTGPILGPPIAQITGFSISGDVATFLTSGVVGSTAPNPNPTIADVEADCWSSTASGAFNKVYPSSSPDFTLTPPSLAWSNNPPGVNENVFMWKFDENGNIEAEIDTHHYQNWEAAINGKMHFDVAGNYSFNLSHDDGAAIGFGGGITKVAGTLTNFPFSGPSVMAKTGITAMWGNNNSGTYTTDAGTINVPAPGDYPVEIDWTNWEHQGTMHLTCTSSPAGVTQAEILNTSQVTALLGNQFTAGQKVYVSGMETGDYLNNKVFTVLSSGLTAYQFEADFTHGDVASVADAGTAEPILATVSGVGTDDPRCNSTMAITAVQLSGNILTFYGANNFTAGLAVTVTGLTSGNGAQLNGWQFYINSADNPDDPLGTPTQFTASVQGNQPFFNTSFVKTNDSGTATFNAVEIYRVSDGGGIYYFAFAVTNPGLGGSPPASGWSWDDYITDDQLDIELIAPLAHLNDPPPGQPGSLVNQGGAIVAYWQGRFWLAVGNRVFFDAGPDAINGLSPQCWPPANVFSFSGPVTALLPTSEGMIVQLSDRWDIILGGPQTLSFYPKDLLKNFGGRSSNHVSQDGDVIRILTTQGQYFEVTMRGKTEEGSYVADVVEQLVGNTFNTWTGTVTAPCGVTVE